VDKSNKRHLERLLEEGKQSILKYLRANGATETAIRSVAQDKFGTFKFKQFWFLIALVSHLSWICGSHRQNRSAYFW